MAVVAAVLGAATVLPGDAAFAGVTPGSYAFEAPGPYSFDEDARSVDGATGTTGADRLDVGTTYRSSLPQDGKLYYRLELDATSNVYVSVTAVPRAGTTVAPTDNLRVTLRDANSRPCSYETVGFGSRSPHPIAAWGARETHATGSSCQGTGTYYLLVERADRSDSSPGAWDLELAPVSEPRLRQTAETEAPEDWNSASPTPLLSEAEHREGGGGFTRATTLGQGVWRDDLRPGQTVFYKVPVDWGQQLYATAELGSSSGDGGLVAVALDMSLYNPVRARVDDVSVSYNGSQKSGTLDPLPPAAYANRYDHSDQVNGMRFAGSYYLVLHLAEQVGERFGDGPFELTLRTRVSGAAEAGPGYAGSAQPPNLFELTAQDREATNEGGSDRSGSGDATMAVVAVGGIGAGTVLLAVLGVWTLVARRRVGAW
ncbi:hypothetical protein [Streptomyces sp. GESEQ-35]|uniref:hypothetical protein n=1 Tax=Streptomyces sp. GESEQ-35 TaxID=2812657 RepID=UPI0027E2D540|nr:hypothetical protein [Streptomyces sp. GESEQ-35]